MNEDSSSKSKLEQYDTLSSNNDEDEYYDKLMRMKPICVIAYANASMYCKYSLYLS